MVRIQSQQAWSRPIVILFVIIAVVASMGLAAEVLKPLAFSVLLAFALSPFARFFERRGLPRVPAVVVTLAIAMGTLGFLGYIVAGQLDHLAGDLSQPHRRKFIDEKLQFFRANPSSNITKVREAFKEVANSVDPGQPKLSDVAPTASGEDSAQIGPERIAGTRTLAGEKIPQVEVVQSPKFTDKLQSAVGPFLEALTVGSFVLILTLFMMITRDDLGDRVISLFGGRKLSTTTRAMQEVGDRIGRYLATNALVNAGFGLTIGIGVWLLGLPYAALWGVMAGVLRFVPYVGTVIAFVLPTTYALASFSGWGHALGVVVLFVVVETALNSFLEPIIYGKTTGVSPLGLLVAAMFWTWLWGVWGLVLSTPITVALAVLGKSIPALSVFSTLLGEDSDLPLDFRFYKRLLALDEDGATEIIDEAIKSRPRNEVYEQILLPALSHAERDFAREEIDESVRAFVLRATEAIVDDLGEESISDAIPQAFPATNAIEPIDVIGVPCGGASDLLALKMLSQVLDPAVARLEIREPEETSLALAESLALRGPSLVLLSHVPPTALTKVRYLLRRLRSHLPEVPILVGRWTENSGTGPGVDRLTAAGASSVFSSLMEARDKIAELSSPKTATAPPLSPALA